MVVVLWVMLPMACCSRDDPCERLLPTGSKKIRLEATCRLIPLLEVIDDSSSILTLSSSVNDDNDRARVS